MRLVKHLSIAVGETVDLILLRLVWFGLVCTMVFNATFNNISVLLVEETEVPEENHRLRNFQSIRFIRDKFSRNLLPMDQIFTSSYQKISLTEFEIIG